MDLNMLAKLRRWPQPGVGPWGVARKDTPRLIWRRRSLDRRTTRRMECHGGDYPSAGEWEMRVWSWKDEKEEAERGRKHDLVSKIAITVHGEKKNSVWEEKNYRAGLRNENDRKRHQGPGDNLDHQMEAWPRSGTILFCFDLFSETYRKQIISHLKCSVQTQIYSPCQLLMVFLKPTVIKVGFFLVARSQDQVQGTARKADSLRAEEVIPRSPPETKSGIWQPQLACSGAPRPRSHVQLVPEPPKKGCKTQQRGATDQWVSARRLCLGSRRRAPREGPPWPAVGQGSLRPRKKSHSRPKVRLNGRPCFKRNTHALSSYTHFCVLQPFLKYQVRMIKKHLDLFQVLESF